MRKALNLENSKLIKEAIRHLSHSQQKSIAPKNSLHYLFSKIKKHTSGYIPETKILEAINTTVYFRTTNSNQLDLIFDKKIKEIFVNFAYATAAYISSLVF